MKLKFKHHNDNPLKLKLAHLKDKQRAFANLVVKNTFAVKN